MKSILIEILSMTIVIFISNAIVQYGTEGNLNCYLECPVKHFGILLFLGIVGGLFIHHLKQKS